MPPKRISKAQAEVMRTRNIVDNIRDMSGLQRGQRPSSFPMPGEPDQPIDPRYQRVLLGAKKKTKDNSVKDLLSFLLPVWKHPWARDFYRRDTEPSPFKSDFTEKLLEALRPIVERGGRNIPDEMKRNLDSLLREYFSSFEVFDWEMNELNSKDLAEMAIRETGMGGNFGRRRIQEIERKINPIDYLADTDTLDYVMPQSMIDKLGETKAKEVLKGMLEGEKVNNPNTGFKKMGRKAFLKSDNPLAAKANKEIKDAFKKKGGKLTKEESTAILDPYLSGEVGRAPAQPAKMSRPRKPKSAQQVRPVTTTGSIFERVKELQGKRRQKVTTKMLDDMFTESDEEEKPPKVTTKMLDDMFPEDEEEEKERDPEDYEEREMKYAIDKSLTQK